MNENINFSINGIEALNSKGYPVINALKDIVKNVNEKDLIFLAEKIKKDPGLIKTAIQYL